MPEPIRINAISLAVYAAEDKSHVLLSCNSESNAVEVLISFAILRYLQDRIAEILPA